MKLKKIITIFMSLNILFSGCTTTEVDVGAKKEVSAYSESSLKVTQPPYIYISNDYSNIEIYSWDRDEVKFEITKRIRGIEKKGELDKKLKGYFVDIKQKMDKIYLKSECRGTNKRVSDKSIDFKIYLPKKTSGINYKLDTGSIKLLDDFRGELFGETNMANVNIEKIEGKINLKSDMGVVNIENGFLYGDCTVIGNMSSISLKSRLDEKGSYNFKTNLGNVELLVSADSKVGVEAIGDVEVNELAAVGYPANIKVSSGMGRIAVRKY